ncbi:MAG: PD-(D/E)XK nuclease family transposase [Kiritimatiellia bacterium]
MARYIDPKADVTFKKVFGEHNHLVISLLNALLHFEDGKQVESIEYFPAEPVPRIPTGKNTIVDLSMYAARRQAGASSLSRCR